MSRSYLLGYNLMNDCCNHVVTRLSARLELEDRARDFGAQEAPYTGKKTTVPIERVCRADPNMFVMQGVAL